MNEPKRFHLVKSWVQTVPDVAGRPPDDLRWTAPAVEIVPRGERICWDVNSLYPFAMGLNALPTGSKKP